MLVLKMMHRDVFYAGVLMWSIIYIANKEIKYIFFTYKLIPLSYDRLS